MLKTGQEDVARMVKNLGRNKTAMRNPHVFVFNFHEKNVHLILKRELYLYFNRSVITKN